RAGCTRVTRFARLDDAEVGADLAIAAPSRKTPFCSLGQKEHYVVVDETSSMDRDKTGDILVTKSDEDAIREIELRFNEAWGRHDPDGMIESLVDDAQFVTVNGAWTKTRDGFRDLMGRLHGANGPFRSSTRETP